MAKKLRSDLAALSVANPIHFPSASTRVGSAVRCLFCHDSYSSEGRSSSSDIGLAERLRTSRTTMCLPLNWHLQPSAAKLSSNR